MAVNKEQSSPHIDQDTISNTGKIFPCLISPSFSVHQNHTYELQFTQKCQQGNS